jgi:hypothetical protein
MIDMAFEQMLTVDRTKRRRKNGRWAHPETGEELTMGSSGNRKRIDD